MIENEIQRTKERVHARLRDYKQKGQIKRKRKVPKETGSCIIID